MVLNPLAGRISDRSTSTLGARAVRGCCAAGLLLAVAFALLFAAPDHRSRVLGGCLGAGDVPGLCATAYAFFQVPYVSMPAEITASYDERTRLDDLAGRAPGPHHPGQRRGLSAPSDPGRGRRARGLPAGRWLWSMALLIVVGVLGGLPRHGVAPRSPRPARAPTVGGLRDQVRVVAGARDFRLLLITYVLQALAVGDDARRRGLPGATRCWRRSGAATILFVCFVGPALLLTPVWSRDRRDGWARSRGYVIWPHWCSWWPRWGPAGGDRALRPTRRWSTPPTALVGVGYAGLPGLPAGDAARRGGPRRTAHGQQPGGGLHRRLDRRRDPRPGGRPRSLRPGAGPGWLPIEHLDR